MHPRPERCVQGRAPIAAGVLFLLCGLALPATASQWEIREATHPLLGPIRFAFTATPFATPVGISRVSSQVYVSCERDRHRIAIEMANSQGPGDPRGLLPREVPRLVCKRATKQGSVHEELDAPFALSELGDVLMRGFRPEALMACSSIAIVQQVELPKGWAQETARIVFDITPATRELRSVLAECGKPAVAEARPAAIQEAGDAGWQLARTIAAGRTKVRAAAHDRAQVVAQLPPNANVLVRKGAGDWWRVKPSAGGTLEGYVRRDRVALR